jgi:hypothetical protein
MDERGQIHHVADDFQRALLEKQHGKLVEIPAEELDAVRALSVPDRQAWFRARLANAEQKRARKEARKRQRAARKASRRAR